MDNKRTKKFLKGLLLGASILGAVGMSSSASAAVKYVLNAATDLDPLAAANSLVNAAADGVANAIFANNDSLAISDALNLAHGPVAINVVHANDVAFVNFVGAANAGTALNFNFAAAATNATFGSLDLNGGHANTRANFTLNGAANNSVLVFTGRARDGGGAAHTYDTKTKVDFSGKANIVRYTPDTAQLFGVAIDLTNIVFENHNAAGPDGGIFELNAFNNTRTGYKLSNSQMSVTNLRLGEQAVAGYITSKGAAGAAGDIAVTSALTFQGAGATAYFQNDHGAAHTITFNSIGLGGDLADALTGDRVNLVFDAQAEKITKILADGAAAANQIGKNAYPINRVSFIAGRIGNAKNIITADAGDANAIRAIYAKDLDLVGPGAINFVDLNILNATHTHFDNIAPGLLDLNGTAIPDLGNAGARSFTAQAGQNGLYNFGVAPLHAAQLTFAADLGQSVTVSGEFTSDQAGAKITVKNKGSTTNTGLGVNTAFAYVPIGIIADPHTVKGNFNGGFSFDVAAGNATLVLNEVIGGAVTVAGVGANAANLRFQGANTINGDIGANDPAQRATLQFVDGSTLNSDAGKSYFMNGLSFKSAAGAAGGANAAATIKSTAAGDLTLNTTGHVLQAAAAGDTQTLTIDLSTGNNHNAVLAGAKNWGSYLPPVVAPVVAGGYRMLTFVGMNGAANNVTINDINVAGNSATLNLKDITTLSLNGTGAGAAIDYSINLFNGENAIIELNNANAANAVTYNITAINPAAGSTANVKTFTFNQNNTVATFKGDWTFADNLASAAAGNNTITPQNGAVLRFPNINTSFGTQANPLALVAPAGAAISTIDGNAFLSKIQTNGVNQGFNFTGNVTTDDMEALNAAKYTLNGTAAQTFTINKNAAPNLNDSEFIIANPKGASIAFTAANGALENAGIVFDRAALAGVKEDVIVNYQLQTNNDNKITATTVGGAALGVNTNVVIGNPPAAQNFVWGVNAGIIGQAGDRLNLTIPANVTANARATTQHGGVSGAGTYNVTVVNNTISYLGTNTEATKLTFGVAANLTVNDGVVNTVLTALNPSILNITGGDLTTYTAVSGLMGAGAQVNVNAARTVNVTNLSGAAANNGTLSVASGSVITGAMNIAVPGNTLAQFTVQAGNAVTTIGNGLNVASLNAGAYNLGNGSIAFGATAKQAILAGAAVTHAGSSFDLGAQGVSIPGGALTLTANDLTIKTALTVTNNGTPELGVLDLAGNNINITAVTPNLLITLPNQDAIVKLLVNSTKDGEELSVKVATSGNAVDVVNKIGKNISFVGYDSDKLSQIITSSVKHVNANDVHLNVTTNQAGIPTLIMKEIQGALNTPSNLADNIKNLPLDSSLDLALSSTSAKMTKEEIANAAARLMVTPNSVFDLFSVTTDAAQRLGIISSGENDELKLGAWVSGSYANAHQKHVAGDIAGYKSTNKGLTVGFDVAPREGTVVGGLFNVSKEKIKYKGFLDTGKDDITAYSGSMYLSHNMSNNFFGSVIATGGKGKVKGMLPGYRNMLASHEYDILYFSPTLSVGHKSTFVDDTVSFVPEVGINALYSVSDGYTETSTVDGQVAAANLRTVSKTSRSKYDVFAKVAVSGKFDISDDITFRPTLRGSVTHKISDKGRLPTVKYANLNALVLAKLDTQRTLYNVGVDFNFGYDNMTYTLSYDRTQSNKKYTNNKFSLTAKVNF